MVTLYVFYVPKRGPLVCIFFLKTKPASQGPVLVYTVEGWTLVRKKICVNVQISRRSSEIWFELEYHAIACTCDRTVLKMSCSFHRGENDG